MKYLCLIYSDETQWPMLSKPEIDKMMSEYREFTSGIQASGHYIGGNRLEPTQAASTVRVRNGKVSTTDGPFAETKEQLGGFYLLNCKDLDEAIEWAAKIPGANGGSIEVRPVMEFE